MQFLLRVVAIMILSGASQWMLPWWTVALCGFLVAVLLPLRSPASFWAGFTAVCVLWMAKAAWIDVRTQQILSQKMASLLGCQNVLTLILLTGFLGGVVGGLGALSGAQLRALYKNSDRAAQRY